MFRRFQLVKTKNLFSRQGKWLFLLVTVLLFALVATTAAQEEADYDIDPPVREPIMIERTVTPAGVNTVWTFFPSQDSFLSSAFPNNNYGGLTTMGVGYDSSLYQAMRTVMQFDVSRIPQNSIINSARLDLYQSGCSPANDVDMGLLAEYMRSSWTEFGVTWNNANYLGGDSIGVGNTNCVLGWKSFDASSVVREWTSGARPNYGFIITGHEGTSPPRTRTFTSRQRATLEPKLIIDWVESCDNVPPTAWVEPLPEWSQESFEVRWTGTDSAPANCNPSGIATYDVQYNINGGSWSTWQNNVTHTSATFTGAANGQTYQFRARATDNAGNVQSWPSAQTQTKIDTVHPEASVLPLNQISFGPNFTVNWDGTDNAGGSGIATYDVQYAQEGGDWIDWVTGTTAKSASFGPAENGETYGFRARATDRAGNVQPYPDGPQTITTVYNNPAAFVIPFDPIILDSTAPSTTTFEVNWIGFPPPGVTISGYNLSWRFNNGSWSAPRLFPGQDTTSWLFAIPEGNSDGIYYFEAAALSSIGSDGLNGTPEASKIVDLEEPFIEVQAYLPLIVDSD